MKLKPKDIEKLRKINKYLGVKNGKESTIHNGRIKGNQEEKTK